jgi:hypothetical protein
MRAHPGSKDGVSNDTVTFSSNICTYALACAHKKLSEIDGEKHIFGLVAPPVRVQFCSRCEAHSGPARACNMKVCAVGSDSMLFCCLTPVLLALFHLICPLCFHTTFSISPSSSPSLSLSLSLTHSLFLSLFLYLHSHLDAFLALSPFLSHTWCTITTAGKALFLAAA